MSYTQNICSHDPLVFTVRELLELYLLVVPLHVQLHPHSEGHGRVVHPHELQDVEANGDVGLVLGWSTPANTHAHRYLEIISIS